MKIEKKITLSLIVSVLLSSNIYAKDVASLDVVTVTAQKQEQNLQEVSASITVFDEFEIEDKNIEKVSDFTNYIPNFMSFQTAGLNGISNPSLRGISALSQSAMISVPIVIDGVPISASLGYDMSLLEVESIEILRGPQGTLYGAGAEAGAINITTKKPDNETRGKVAVQFGSDDKRQYSFNASGAIIKDKVYIGIAGKYYEKDGYIKNLNSGNMMNDKENKYGKIHLRYTPTDNLDISFISTKSKRDDGSNNLNLLYQPREVTSNLEGYNRSDIVSNVLKVEYSWDDYAFESITAKRDFDMIFEHDFDFSDATKFHQTKSNFTDKLSQEFRLSKKDETFSWLLGLYADNEDSGYHAIQDKLTPSGLKHIDATQDLTSQTLGIFAHSKYSINSKVSLITGLRYDKVDKTLEESAKNIDLDDSYSEVSPKVSLEYKIDKDITTFATIAKGFNPGGVNPHSSDSSKKAFGSEKLISYEVGVKSSLLNDKVTLNGAVYYIDLGNIQTVHYAGPTDFYMSNNANGSSKGFELEAQAKITNTINMFVNYGYNDITFDTFSDSKGDYSENIRPYAPKYNFSIGTQYRNISGYYARVDVTGYGKMYLDNANKYERKAYELANAKLGYELEHFNIYLYGKNLFDKNHDTHGFSDRFTIYSEPRELGVQLAYNF